MEMSGLNGLYALVRWTRFPVASVRLFAWTLAAVAVFVAASLYAATLTPGSSPADGQAILDNEERVIYKIELDGSPPPADKAVNVQLTILDGSVGVGVNSTVVSELNLYVDTADPADPLLVAPASELTLNPVQANTVLTLAPAPQPTIPNGASRWVYVTAKFYGLAGAQTITLDPNVVITLEPSGGGAPFNPAGQTLGAPAVFSVSPSGGGGGGGGNSGGGGGGGSSGIVFDLAAARADSDSTVSAFGTVTEVPFGGEWIFALVAFACGLFYLYTRQPR